VSTIIVRLDNVQRDTHTHTQNVGLFWTTDQPVENTSPWQHA